jgi:hypothetical protein
MARYVVNGVQDQITTITLAQRTGQVTQHRDWLYYQNNIQILPLFTLRVLEIMYVSYYRKRCCRKITDEI